MMTFSRCATEHTKARRAIEQQPRQGVTPTPEWEAAATVYADAVDALIASPARTVEEIALKLRAAIKLEGSSVDSRGGDLVGAVLRDLEQLRKRPLSARSSRARQRARYATAEQAKALAAVALAAGLPRIESVHFTRDGAVTFNSARAGKATPESPTPDEVLDAYERDNAE